MKKIKRKRPLPRSPETVVRGGTESEEGVPLLEWRVEIPFFGAASPGSEAASFYETVARRCEGYLTGRMTDLLRKEYLASDVSRRRFSFRPAVYVHSARVASDNDVLTVTRTVLLKRAGRVLFSRTFRERWDETDGTPIPSPDETRKAGVPAEKRAKKSGKKVDAGAHGML